jgi:hypothetical protein
MNELQFEDALSSQFDTPVQYTSEPCCYVGVNTVSVQPPGNPAELFRTTPY